MSFPSTRPRGLIVSAKNSAQIRFDTYLAAQGLVVSRHQAGDLIRRRQVKLDGRICEQADKRLDVNGRYRIQLLIAQPYVSRGGYKLAAALDTFKLPVKDRLAFDIGASVGGFTDVLVRRGARQIVALDVGTQMLSSQLAEQTNILAFNRSDIRTFVWPPHLSLPDLIVADLSFISLTKIMPALVKFCHATTDVLVLAKPQFETQAGELSKGVIKNQAQRREILRGFEAWLKSNDWRILAKTDAGLKGLKGNLERFYLLKSCVIQSKRH